MVRVHMSLYQQVVDTCQEYLGPAADRFVTRQIQTHLGKKPDDLTQEDLTELTDWIKIAISFLTDDTQVVEEFGQNLLKLSSK